MNFIQKQQDENNPYVQLLMLLFYALLGITIFLILGIIILFAMYGMELINNPQILASGDVKYKPALQITLVAQSIGLFLAPAIFIAMVEKKRINNFYGFKRLKIGLIGVVLLIMIASMPLMEWVMLANQKMVLPDFLKSIEEWMRRSEDSMMRTTLILLKINGIGDFLITFFVVAVVPAVCEEFMFRGALQRTFLRIFKNPHVAIWTSAFLFSAIHLQFYGFLPRFLLGAGFGYIYYLSGSLWYAMLAHFLNNAYAVCAAWYMQKNNIPLSEADNTTHFAWYGYLISFILTILVFKYFKTKTLKPYEQQLD